jgi:cytosine/adenosine deaminase-related metal-dependent hydrolase
MARKQPDSRVSHYSFREGLIQAIAPQAELCKRYHDADQHDAGGQNAIPGNFCAHTHFHDAFLLRLAIPDAPSKYSPEILHKLWWDLDHSLTEQDINYYAQVIPVEAIRHGSTTLIQHHTSPNAIPGSVDVIADAVDQSGLRTVLCNEVTDHDGEIRTKAGKQENVHFIKRSRKEDSAEGRVAATYGLHARLTQSEAILDACRYPAPEDSGFHIPSPNTWSINMTAWRNLASGKWIV